MLVATWSMNIDEDTLIKEMLATGEYGMGGYPISEESMTEFFRNWAFGLDPNTYKAEWARNPLCGYFLEVTDSETDRQLWIQVHHAKESV